MPDRLPATRGRTGRKTKVRRHTVGAEPQREDQHPGCDRSTGCRCDADGDWSGQMLPLASRGEGVLSAASSRERDLHATFRTRGWHGRRSGHDDTGKMGDGSDYRRHDMASHAKVGATDPSRIVS